MDTERAKIIRNSFWKILGVSLLCSTGVVILGGGFVALAFPSIFIVVIPALSIIYGIAISPVAYATLKDRPLLQGAAIATGCSIVFNWLWLFYGMSFDNPEVFYVVVYAGACLGLIVARYALRGQRVNFRNRSKRD